MRKKELLKQIIKDFHLRDKFDTIPLPQDLWVNIKVTMQHNLFL